MTAHNSKTRRTRPGVVKLIGFVTPPDEQTIRKLNGLAAQHPFCSPYKVKKHDTL